MSAMLEPIATVPDSKPPEAGFAIAKAQPLFAKMKSPSEFKIMPVRECAPAQLVVIPPAAVKYWRLNVTGAPWFDPARKPSRSPCLTPAGQSAGTASSR